MAEERLTFLKKMDIRCKSSNIIFRNNSYGLWLSSLLFLSYLQTILRNPYTIQLEYELITVLIAGMMLQSIEIFISFVYIDQLNILKFLMKIFPTIVITTIFNLILNQDMIFSLFTSSTVMLIYYLLLMYTLKSMPRCFTFGEATIVAQGLVIFLYNCFLQLPYINQVTTISNQLNIILQMGLLDVLFLIITTHFIPVFRKWYLFYPLLLFLIITLCLTLVNGESAAVILWNFVFSDIERSAIVVGYTIFLILAAYTIWIQIKKNQRGSTATRKIFHVLIVLVYLPGLMRQCYFLYVASVVILAILIIIELARVIKLYPIAEILDAAVVAFIDEQDSGNIALTPIYLLIGCSIPLWIHNSPCDMTNSSGSELLPLLAGILSIGIGDTFASAIGSKIGRHKWSKNSQKSVEGTLASIFAQGIFIYGLCTLQFLNLSTRLMIICGVAVISNALIEAFTLQVDNLILPIVTYIILSYK